MGHAWQIITVAAITSAIASSGCESVPGGHDDAVPLDAIFGTWAADAAPGAHPDVQSRLRFSTAEGHWHGAWITVDEAGVDVVRFRYELRPHKGRPDRFNLDMHAFDSGPLKGQWMYGLLEWMDDGAQAFRLDMEPGPTSEPSLRPDEISEDATTYRRVID